MRLTKAIDGFLLSKQADSLSDTTSQIYCWVLDKLVLFLGDPRSRRHHHRQSASLVSVVAQRICASRYPRQGETLGCFTSKCVESAKSFYSGGEREIGLKRVDIRF